MKLFILLCMSIYVYDIVINLIYLNIINKKLILPEEKIMNLEFKKLYILIPMMEEQVIASETFNHFFKLIKYKKEYNLIFITTAREKRKEKKLHTYDIINNLMKKNMSSNIKLFHYEGNGVMAHQLNYGISKINEFEDEDYWIAIYNADSRLNEDTFEYFEYYVKLYEKKKDDFCFQQYSYFQLPNGIKKKSIIGQAVLWQNRWSLLFEFSRANFQNFLEKNISKYKNTIFYYILNTIFGKMNYVIGHGLFIRKSTLSSVGYFPENTINEDAFLGYLLNNKQVKIYPLPVFEEAEFVNNVKNYIKQQSVWYNGPLDAFSYYKTYLKKNFSPSKKIEAFILAFKLFLHAIYWIFSPFLLLIILPICAFLEFKIMGLLYVIILILLLLPSIDYQILSILKRKYKKKNFPKISFFYNIIFYFIHSIGPIRNLYLRIKKRNHISNKYKTERNKNKE